MYNKRMRSILMEQYEIPSLDSESVAEKGKHEKKTQERITYLAGQLDDEWRKSRWQEETGSYEPRIKLVEDLEWTERHGGAVEVDIANTAYEDLPSKWQKENKESAVVAITEVEKALEGNRELNESFLEDASAVLHDKWLERNRDWASIEQSVPYGELSEEEKEKDRVIIRRAIFLCVTGE